MQSHPRAIFDLFEAKRRYVIPMFQRQYVWSADRQWQPLWEDVERKTIERMRWREKLAASTGEDRAQVENAPPTEHFLGAIVLDAIRTFGNEIQAHTVIDGQQRLTTLQVFLAGFRDVAAKHGDTAYVEELTRHTRNIGVMVDPKIETFKFWPTNADQTAFKRVMESGNLDTLGTHYPEVLKRHGAGAPKLVQAYAFFWHRIDDLLSRQSVSERLAAQPDLATRIRLLYETLRYDLLLVSIELEGRDDPQVIFETLNARGEPLLPSDLLRNYLFWRANHQKADVDALYSSYWQPFDTEFWKKEEKQGRLKRPRVDLYFANLLQLKTTAEVNIGRLFHEYKEWSEKTAKYPSVQDELAEIARYASPFELLLKPSDQDQLSRFAQMLEILDVKTIFPLVMKLIADGNMGDADLFGTFQDIESYLVRRMVCGLTTKNYNKVFIGWMSKLGNGTITRTAIREVMLEIKGEAGVWPNDASFLVAWTAEPIYLRLKPVSRLEYVLRQLEIEARTNKHEDVTIKRGLTVEHVLPQSWYEFWPLADGSTGRTPEERLAAPCADSERRDRVLHTIGNLTLLTQSANNSLRNRAFQEKVDKIEGYSLLALNTYFKKLDHWDEASIDSRARHLFEAARTIWPYPNP